jgi:hypothetical protein
MIAIGEILSRTFATSMHNWPILAISAVLAKSASDSDMGLSHMLVSLKPTWVFFLA